ncbi:hypothetical protein [Methanobacterium paludis]|uniref:Uncharacterized protein n=1 Tax=Methanobacterium paludis (strain DSM 25820 / JCM 18151 / SWAN1) TaxID=868131 RepID=F6D621_METPW|nr:hypothetical protein [Methanobacterium paludis]AEG17669.1 hypothetical protein MSWAN_0633 [Methanobacterium paludis]
MFKVQIKGDKTSLEILDKNFENIKFEEDNYFLECPEFEKIDEKEIFPFAEEKLKQMLFLINLKIDNSCNAEVGAIEKTKKDGTKCMLIITVPPITSTLKVGVPHITITNNETGEIIHDSQKSSEDLNQYIKCVNENKDIKDVINYFRQVDSFNFSFNYYKIIEIIGKDLGSKQNIPKQFKSISRKKFSNLTQTLNYGLGENSRHYTESKDKILSEEEIKRFMNNIIQEWISVRCK